MKELKDLTFDELVDEAAGRILQELIAGKFRSAVFTSLDLAIRWDREQRNQKLVAVAQRHVDAIKTKKAARKA